jgi:hypothetical protein
MVVITTGTKRIATSFLLTLVTSLSIILLISSIAPTTSSSAAAVVVVVATTTVTPTPIQSPPFLNQTTSLSSNPTQFPNTSLQNQSSPSSPYSITTATNTTTADTTPPDTAITSAVDDNSGANIQNGGTISSPSSSISFTFTGTDDVASVVAGYQCSIDGLPAALCKSPVSVFNNNNQASGNHTFQVRAIDTSGNVDPSPAIFTWIIANVSGSSDGNSDQQQNNEPLYNIQPITFSK